jgi:hypothetical protein
MVRLLTDVGRKYHLNHHENIVSALTTTEMFVQQFMSIKIHTYTEAPRDRDLNFVTNRALFLLSNPLRNTSNDIPERESIRQ